MIMLLLVAHSKVVRVQRLHTRKLSKKMKVILKKSFREVQCWSMASCVRSDSASVSIDFVRPPGLIIFGNNLLKLSYCLMFLWEYLR